MLDLTKEPAPAPPAELLQTLDQIQQRVLWLATNMIHHANYVRPNPDGTKVGGHQASSASMVTLMTALYFHYLRAGDRVSVKPHASPVFHAIQYLLGQLDRRYLTELRAYKGLQSYPSRTKDPDPVDFSTGSVGLGAVAPAFAALANDYAQAHFGRRRPPETPKRRFIALIGDAELDEGNVWEAVLDEPLRRLGNLVWIVDLNRQSLDRVVPGIKAARLKRLFADCGWQVLEAKYGRTLQHHFAQPGGEKLRSRIDTMRNEEYQALIRLPGAELRERLPLLEGELDPELAELLQHVPEDELPGMLQNLGGHDFAELFGCLSLADAETTRPTIIFAYTIKGWGLPIAGHPLNHSMLLDETQMAALRERLGVGADEWAAFPSDSPPGRAAAAAAERLYGQPTPQPDILDPAHVPDSLDIPTTGTQSTQQTFGRLLLALSREEPLVDYLVTASPDVSVSTNLAGWIAKEGVFNTREQPRYLEEINQAAMWPQGPKGRHVELGISEMNLFMLLGMFGLTAELVDQLLIPIGTVYDPFVARGLDAFIYSLYSGAKFIIAGTPSGITLAPEGGAHQSTITSSLGTELPGLNYFEPCYAQELTWVLLEALRHCCDREHGRASYLRLSTKPVDQQPFHDALARLGEETLRRQVLAGGYRLLDGALAPGVDPRYRLHIATTGAMVPEALDAARVLHEEGIAATVINLTSPRRLFETWRALPWGVHSPVPGESHAFDWLIPAAERGAPLITVNDGAAHALSWLGSVFGGVVVPLGVDDFGQVGTRDDLYRHYGIDSEAIVEAGLVALNRCGVD